MTEYSSTPSSDPTPQPNEDAAYLTPDCRTVQEEMRDLAQSLADAPLDQYGALKPTLLRGVQAFRAHLARHVAAVIVLRV